VSAPDRRIEYLTVADLLEIAVGVVGEVAVRDRGLLASAAGRPQSTVFGEDAYPTFAAKAAALMHSLARNHALVDGNKRLAWAATRVFCLLNGRDLAFEVDDAEALVLAVARGELDVADIAASIDEHLR
jgi:death-on-curing protein